VETGTQDCMQFPNSLFSVLYSSMTATFVSCTKNQYCTVKAGKATTVQAY